MKKISLIALAMVMALAFPACGSKEAEPVETPAEEEQSQPAAPAAEFDLFAGEDAFADIQVGEWYGDVGRVDCLTLSFPEGYTLKDGRLYGFEGGEKVVDDVEGVLSELVSSNRINLADRVLGRFYIGTGDFDPMDPSNEDTVFQVTIYSDWWKVEGEEYKTSANDLDYYGRTGEGSTYNPTTYLEVDVPIDDYIYVMIRCIHAPGIENASIEEFADTMTQYIRPAEPVQAASDEASEDGEADAGRPDLAPAEGFGTPILYNGEDISDNVVGALIADGWRESLAVSETVEFTNRKYPDATFSIRFTEQIDDDPSDGEISNRDAIYTSQIRRINLVFDTEKEHPTFEFLGISNEMTPEQVVKATEAYELEDPSSWHNSDNLQDEGIGSTHRADILADGHIYTIDIMYRDGVIIMMDIWREQ